LLPKLILGVWMRLSPESTRMAPVPPVQAPVRRGRWDSDPMVCHSPSSLPPFVGAGAGGGASLGAALGALRPRYSGSEPIVD
jgi:hypothetical protein